ncbi:MAG: hypothetical protein PHU97_06345 [Bacteroidales bacterium]|nr:hypothetical protein [Bacteroidales bacterium]HPE86040.1 hypothetical protein [Bacteroidales bacterium]
MKENILELTKAHIEQNKGDIHGNVADLLINELENFNTSGMKFYLSPSEYEEYDKDLIGVMKYHRMVFNWIKKNFNYSLNQINVISQVGG